MRKSLKLSALAALIVAAVVAFCSATAVFARADDPVAVLTPLDLSSGISYRYFDDPTSVYADTFGIYVADGDTVVTVSLDGAAFEETAVTAQKIQRHNGYFVALADGVITYYGDAPSACSAASFTDFDIFGDTIYAIDADTLYPISIAEGALDTSVMPIPLVADTFGMIDDINAISIAAGEQGVFVSVDSAAFKGKQDIAALDTETGVLSVVSPQSDRIASLAMMRSSGMLYALTGDRLIGYDVTDGLLHEKYIAHDSRMSSICAYDGFLYGPDTLDALYKIPADLSAFDVIVASADKSDGFFNMPMSATAKNSALYVADYGNGRIAKIGKTVTYFDGYKYPVDVACDSRGELYVAHDRNKIKFGDTEVAIPSATIRRLEINADKTLFILTDKGIYSYKVGDESPVLIQNTSAYKDITLGIGHDELFALSASSVDALDVSGDTATASAVCDADPSAFSLAVDLDRNVYMLSNAVGQAAVTRFDKVADTYESYPLTLDGKPYRFGRSSGQIIISTVMTSDTDDATKKIDYRDAVVVDTYKHRVFSIDGSDEGLDVKLVDDDYPVPDVKDDTSPEAPTDGLIRVALYDTQVYGAPGGITPPAYTIAEGRKVICPDPALYGLEENPYYTFVLIDNIEKGVLVQGYVYKDSLSDPLEYSSPPTENGSIYSKATPIYKWPSRFSRPVDGYSAMDKGSSVKLLSFVASYRDDYNNLWYRVLLDDRYEGYVLDYDLSLNGYEPVFIRPAYNAEIISYNNSEYAEVYAVDEQGNYVKIDGVTLATGTQVEVIGAFDTSEHYTQIKYLDAELGTLTCWVETVYLKYNGVNVVLIVAIVVIVITVILAAIIIARVIFVKKKRLSSPSSGVEERDL